MTRSILTWRIHGEDLVGTLHEPTTIPSERGPRFQDLGVLLLNAGAAPRAGNSDLSVHIGERLAAAGIPVFRFDFAGLGDSTGATPEDKCGYWESVVEGRNDAATLALVRRIKRQFGLSRLIVGGLCSAALPALRVADRDARDVAGLLLLEPALHMTIPRVGSDPAAIAERVNTSRLRRAFSLREWLLFLTGESKVARAARPLRAPLLSALRASAGHTLPRDANVTLIAHWQSCLLRGIPALAVVAEGQRIDGDIPRILHTFSGPCRALVDIVRVPRTNHILTSGGARDVVLDAAERWVQTHFAEAASRGRTHAGA
ncbi:MAG TPA: alpha/beta fold hydrolase [Planctomycetota bacterium]|nr:alpha/beta fold hydrolase [Planctomycetota bacterium]